MYFVIRGKLFRLIKVHWCGWIGDVSYAMRASEVVTHLLCRSHGSIKGHYRTLYRV